MENNHKLKSNHQSEPAVPLNEKERLEEVSSFSIVGEEEHDDFNILTRMAAEICGTKISLLCFITEDKQQILSHHGIDIRETSRDNSFCAYAINEPNSVFIVEDAGKDARFKNNPFVKGEPHAVFYAGVPIVSENNLALGTLCVIDDTPHSLSDYQLDSLQLLAKQAMKFLELQKYAIVLEEKNKELRKKDELFGITQSVNKIGAWELDIESGQTYWSDEVYKIHELDTDYEHNRSKAVEFYHPDDRKIISGAIEDTLNTGKPFNVTARLITAKNNLRWIRSTGGLRTMEGDKKVLMGSFQDITDYRTTENDLRKERTRINNILKGTNVGHWEWNVQTGETVYNERWANITGYTLNELEPISIETWTELTHPDDLEESKWLLQLCFEKEREFYEFEARMKHKDDRWVWVYDRGKVSSWTEDGKPLMMYGTRQDITNRKIYEERLRISEEAFRGNFENAAIGMAILDEKGNWLNANNRVCKILGYSEEQLLNLTFQDLTHPDDLDSDLVVFHELTEGTRDYYHTEKRYIHKDGHVLHAILGASVVKDPQGNILYFIFQIIDITDQKHAEKNLSSALAKNQATMDASTQVAIISTDLDGIITEFNEGAEQMLGYKAEELVGKFTPQVIYVDDEITKESKLLFEETGDVVEGFDVFMYRVKNGIPYTREWTFKRKDGSTYPVQLSETAIKQGDEITGFLGVATDISKLKKAESEIKTILSITQNQNDRLQNFSHIVTHNLRTHAGGIFGVLEILKFENPEAYSNEYIQLLEKGVENLKDTIVHLTDLVEQGFAEQNDFKEVALQLYIERNKNGVITLAMEKGVEIINDVDDQIKVHVIPGYLDSILVNFMTNAIKYCDHNKESYVRISAETSEDFVVLIFEDNGLGIDLEKNGKHLFAMFKTFHENEDSRGLGCTLRKIKLNLWVVMWKWKANLMLEQRSKCIFPNQKQISLLFLYL